MTEIEKMNFYKIGEYHLFDNLIQCSYLVKKTQRKSIVYIMTVDSQIMYIGKTIQGYKRPLSYNKNKVMKTVRNGIEVNCKLNKKVEVFARDSGLNLKFENLRLNIIEAYEQALITKFKPLWNNQIQK